MDTIGILVQQSLNLLVLFTVTAHQVMERKALFLFRVKSHGIREVVWLFTGTMRTVKKRKL